MPELLAELWDKICRVLAVVGFDQVVVAVGDLLGRVYDGHCVEIVQGMQKQTEEQENNFMYSLCIKKGWMRQK
jgi:hypothetical protein